MSRVKPKTSIITLLLLAAIFFLPFIAVATEPAGDSIYPAVPEEDISIEYTKSPAGATTGQETGAPQPSMIDIYYYDASGHADFAVYSRTDPVEICSCGSYTDYLKITNFGMYGARYSLEPDNRGIVISEKEFDLQPGESKDVYIYVEVPCSQKQGLAQFKITIQSNLGPQEVVTKKIDVNKCQNLKVSLSSYVPEIDPCEKPVDFVLSVKNIGSFEEEYVLDLGKYSEWAKATQSSFVLKPSESKEVSVRMDFPCSIYGEQIIPFNVRSVRNGLSASAYGMVDIRQSYDYTMFTDSKKTLCQGKESSLLVGIENKAAVPNNYSFTVKGAPFLSLEKKSLSLEGFGTDSVKIIATPKSHHKGSYNITITSFTEIGSVENTITMALDVVECRNRGVYFDAQKDEFCAEERQYELVVTNNGIVDESVAIMLSAPEFVSIDETEYMIPPGQEERIPIIVDTPDQDAKYRITAVAEFSDGERYSRNLDLRVMSAHTCHLVRLDKSRYNVDVEDNELAVKAFDRSFAGGNYKASIEGPEWIILETSEFSFEDLGYRYLIFSLSPDEDTEPGKYSITITLEHIDSGYTYSYPVVVTLHEKPYLVLAFRYATATACRAAKTALLAVTAVFVIILIIQALRIHKRRKMRNWKQVKTPKKLLLAVVLFLIFTTAAIIMLMLNPPVSMYKPLEYTDPSEIMEEDIFYEWAEDSPFRIDLLEYFEDPDNDVLRFTSTQPKNMKVAVDGSIATIKPDKDWFGYRTIVFTASDLRGGVTDSPLMTLHVVEREDFTIWEIASFYCWYVNLGIFFIALVVFYLIFLIQGRISALEKDKIEKREATRTAKMNGKKYSRR